MRHTPRGGATVSGFAAAALLLGAVVMGSLGATAQDHPVVGRWVIEAEPGGAVWAFQPTGELFLSGPGDVVAEGSWTPAIGEGEFDASVDVEITGQILEVLGQVAPDDSAIALYVTATDATRPDDWTPWPAESRLTGGRFGMGTDETPEPSEPPVDCQRPEWIDGIVDWDRCDDGLTS